MVVDLPQVQGPLAPYIQQEIDYILAHKERVKQAYQFFKDIGFISKCQKVMSCLNLSILDKIIEEHDNSKFTLQEFDFYRQWFYPAPGERKSKDKLNIGLFHHLHSNPHHWQYYLTYETKYNDGEKILKMPCEYIVEMLCDWYSFSIKEDNAYSIFDWYLDNKDEIILNSTTQNIVETLLVRLRNCIRRYQRSLGIQNKKDSDIIYCNDEKLSPMSYKKLVELGYSREDWKGKTQEWANNVIASEVRKKNIGKPESGKHKQPSESNEQAYQRMASYNISKVDGPSGSKRFIQNYIKEHPNSNVQKEAKKYLGVLSNVKDFKQKYPNAEDGTYDAVTGELLNVQDGYCVTFHQNLTPDNHYGAYNNEIYALMCAIAKEELRSDSVNIGYFTNPEISFVCKDRDTALRFMVEHNQQVIYDPQIGDIIENKRHYNKRTNPIKGYEGE